MTTARSILQADAAASDRVTPDACGVSLDTLPSVAREATRRWLSGEGQAQAAWDQPDATCECGGVFVSLRERKSGQRIGRGGSWNLTAAPVSLRIETARAAIKALSGRPKVDTAVLDNCVIAVTVFSPLEPIEPRQLDCDQYGIVVVAREQPHAVGGALPNSPEFADDIGQYQHAIKNAGILPATPHSLFRHRVEKVVEKNEAWQPFGVSCDRSRRLTGNIAARLTRHVRSLVCDNNATSAFQELPASIAYVAVLAFIGGETRIGIEKVGQSSDCLRIAAHRLREAMGTSSSQNAVFGAAILYDACPRGQMTADAASKAIRYSKDAVLIEGTGGTFFSLPFDAIHRGLSPTAAAACLQAKAGSRPCKWTTFSCEAYIEAATEGRLLSDGYPDRTPREEDTSLDEWLFQLGDYVVRHTADANFSRVKYCPQSDSYVGPKNELPALTALEALATAGDLLCRGTWRETALARVKGWIDTCGDAVAILPSRSMLQAQYVLRREGMSLPQLEGALQGTAIPECNLVLALQRPPNAVLGAKLNALLGQQIDPASMARWAAGHYVRLCDALASVSADEAARVAFPLADAALRWQHERTGAFLVMDEATGCGYRSALVLDWVTLAWELAIQLRDHARERRLRSSWTRACAFLRRLTVHQADTFHMRQPKMAIGGVRSSLYDARIRIDAVGYALQVGVKGKILLANSGGES